MGRIVIRENEIRAEEARLISDLRDLNGGLEILRNRISGGVNESIFTLFNNNRKLLLAAILATFVLAIGIGLFISRSIAIPIRALTRMAEEISNGNLDVGLQQFTAKDEIGGLASSFNRMSGHLKIARDDLEQKVTDLEQTQIGLQDEIAVRERIEAALRQSEAHSRNFLESAAQGVVIADVNGGIVLVNRRTEELFGYAREELMGQTIETLVPDRFRSGHMGLRQHYHSDPHSRQMGMGLDLIGRRSDGSEFPVDISLSPVETDEGVLVLALVTDITERKRAEEALENRAIELNAVNKELESFSYSVSHDLRAPLRSVDGFGQALLEDYSELLDAQGKDYIHRMRAASQRMGESIDGLLKLSQVTRSEMRRERVDLSRLVQAVAAELQTTQPLRCAEFVIQEGIVANGDAKLLRVVLDNLLSNAWKFTGSRELTKIEFGVTPSGVGPAYFVRDNGAGFDMAYVDKLFGAFQRLHAVTEFEGMGIGLATVKRIVHRHGGEVWAEGETEVGATFYFTLI